MAFDKLESLPVVDMQAEDAPAVLHDACSKYGFFYLSNHGIDQGLVDEVFEQTRAFFALPTERKMDVVANKLHRGYTPFMEEILDPEHQSQGDSKEGYYIGREVAADSEETKWPLHGPNQWPDPSLLPTWRPVMERYFAAVQDLGLRTVRLMCRALGIDEHQLDGKFTRPLAALRLLHYNDQVSDPDSGIYGAGAHSDYGMFTFLVTDETPGLEILLGGRWRPVTPVREAFIVNLGDMLQRWTNDAFKSTVHRVVNRVGRERYSIPFFYEPNFDTVVTALPGFTSDDNPARYPPITSGEYLISKYNKTHLSFKDPRTAQPDQPSTT